jgi:hypothetical protein
MKKTLSPLALGALVALAACSSSSASPDAPVISGFTMTSPVPAGTTVISGQVSVEDPSGLADVTVDMTITGNGVDLPISNAVMGGSAAVTAATVPLEVAVSTAIPAGSYNVTLTLSEAGVKSNVLTTTVVVQ